MKSKPFVGKEHRSSQFELNNGLHKQRSSLLKLEKEARISKMMSAVTGVVGGRTLCDSSPPNRQGDITPGLNLKSYDWKVEQHGSATFSNFIQQTKPLGLTTATHSQLSSVESDEDELNAIPFSKKSKPSITQSAIAN